MSTKKTGTDGEQFAKKFLLEKGYTVLFENWRHKRSEIERLKHL